tara:strand:+ start:33349 stop:35913 length:2565 start_codon:yes stop_codon:yes gene_type:complete
MHKYGLRKNYYAYTVLLCFSLFLLNGQVAFAATKNRSRTTNQEIPTKAPKGFDNLNQKMTNVIDVYYGGRQVGEIKAIYNDNTIQFSDPAEVVRQLSNVTNKPLITRALAGVLNSNSHLICSAASQRSNCGVLHPEIASVIFDPNNFRVDVFVNPKYLNKALTTSGLLPNSDAGFSYLSNFNAVTSGSTSSGFSNTNNFNFSSDNTFAYKNMKINTSVSYGNDVNQTSKQQLYFNELNGAYYSGDHLAKAGIIQSNGDLFVTNQNILGVSYGTTLDTVQQDSANYGSQLTVFLPTPSTVSIYKDGRLITSRQYPMGNQVLDTSSLPTGAYQITLQISDSQGRISRETRFYAKSNEIPPLNYPQYYFNMGFLEKNQFVSDSIVPGFENNLLYQAGMNRRITQYLGINGDLTGTFNNVFLTTGAFFLGNGFQIGPEVMVGSKSTVGVGVQEQSNLGAFQSTFFVRQIWSKGDTDNTGSFIPINGLDNNQNDFSSIQQNQTQVSGNLSYQIGSALLGIVGNLSKNQGLPSTYSYGPEFRMPVYTGYSTNIQFSAYGAKTQDDLQIIAQFILYFSSPHWIQNATAGYQANLDKQPGTQPSNAIGNFGTYWRDLNAAQEGVQLGVQGNTQNGTQSLGTSIDYTNHYAGMYGSVTHNFASTTAIQNTQYSANVQTHFAYADGKAVIGGPRAGDTGIIVYVSSNHPGDKFEVYVDGQVKTIVATDTATPIFLPPFRTYRIRIRDISSEFYNYDETPQLVTLYQGNVRTLTWKTRVKLILYGHITQPNGLSLRSRRVYGGLGINATDYSGNLQAEVYDNATQLTASYGDGKKCIIDLPKLESKQHGLIEIGNIVCRPASKTL